MRPSRIYIRDNNLANCTKGRTCLGCNQHVSMVYLKGENIYICGNSSIL